MPHSPPPRRRSPTTAHADPEVVVTATRVPTPVVDIPAGVSVIDRQTIEERGYTTLTDALSAVPGIHVSQSGGPGGNASVFVRGTNSNQVLVLRDGMPLNDAVRLLRRVQLRRRYAGRCRAHRGHPRPDGGAVRLRRDRRRDQPDLAPAATNRASTSPAIWPAAIRSRCEGNVNASGIEGPLDYSVTFEAQSQRGYDTTPQRMSIYTGVPDGFRDLTGTLNLGYTPIDGTRLSLFLRARRAVFGFNALGNPTFDDSNSTGQDDIAARPHRRHLEAVQRHLRDRRVSRPPAERPALHRGAQSARSQPGRATTRATTAIAPTCSGTTRCTCNDLIDVPSLSATDLTFGYEHIADNINVKVNSVLLSASRSRSRRRRR